MGNNTCIWPLFGRPAGLCQVQSCGPMSAGRTREWKERAFTECISQHKVVRQGSLHAGTERGLRRCSLGFVSDSTTVRQRKVDSVFRGMRHLFAPGLNVLGLVVFCLASSGCSETRTVNQVPTPDARADVRPTTVQARSTVQSQPTSQGDKTPRHPLPPLEPPARTQGGFVGSEACQGCHTDEYAAWSGSTHGRAGGPVSDDILIPKGGERRFSFSDTEVSLVSS